MNASQPPLDTLPHWLNGQPDPLRGGRRADVYDPAHGRVVRRVALASQADVADAVASAAAAQPAWGALPPQRRARVLFRMQELVTRHSTDLARLKIGRAHV